MKSSLILVLVLLPFSLFHFPLAAQTATPIPLTPAATPIPRPSPPLSASATIPAATVSSALAALSSFISLPSGVTPARIRAISITFLPDGSASVRVTYTSN